MHGYKFENKIFKLFIGGNTASDACSMQQYKNGICFIRKSSNRWLKKMGKQFKNRNKRKIK
ncbi:MAG TPA: hypothetical protein DCR91_10480 [Eubacterium sp.]|jgi:hypothetical protein|nr:hypothetical protein [Eubacterium sp.]HBM95924.1 hypothetical protein [Eubacterium sp.]